MAAEIGKIEDILLETGTTETNGAFQKLGTNSGIGANGSGHFVDVCPRSFAKSGDCIDARYPLGKESIGRQLGQFGRPKVGRYYSILAYPAFINPGYGGHCLFALGCSFTTDQNTVGILKVADSSAFGKEFGIGNDLILENRFGQPLESP